MWWSFSYFLEIPDPIVPAFSEHLREMLDFTETHSLLSFGVSCTASTRRSYMLHVRTTPNHYFRVRLMRAFYR